MGGFTFKKKKSKMNRTLVHLNRLVNKKQLSIVFWNGVQQSKESHEPKTCAGEVRRLCDLDVRTRTIHLFGVIYFFTCPFPRSKNKNHRCCGGLFYGAPSGIRLSRELRAQSFAGKTHPPEEFSTRLLLRIPFGKKKKNTTQGGVCLFWCTFRDSNPGPTD